MQIIEKYLRHNIIVLIEIPAHMGRDDNVLKGDFATALQEWEPSAEQGYVKAQVALGLMYNYGWGVAPNYPTAVKWFLPAAEQGNAVAQFNLGLMYYNGYGVIQDKGYAHMWWNIAASQWNENAAKNRDIVAKRMTPADISATQSLARECVRSIEVRSAYLLLGGTKQMTIRVKTRR